MATAGELQRLQWLGKSVQEELQRVHRGHTAKAAPPAPAAAAAATPAAPAQGGTKESKAASAGATQGAPPAGVALPDQIRNSFKAIGRSLSRTVKNSDSASATPSEPSTPRGGPSEGSGPDSVPAVKKVQRWLSRTATGEKSREAAAA